MDFACRSLLLNTQKRHIFNAAHGTDINIYAKVFKQVLILRYKLKPVFCESKVRKKGQNIEGCRKE